MIGIMKSPEDSSAEGDEERFNETLKRLLNTPPKPHKPKDDEGKGPTKKSDPEDH
jgi:hypothetical protein